MIKELTLLVFGILLFLLGLAGKFKFNKIEVGIKSKTGRFVLVLAGIALAYLSFNPDITKTLSSPTQKQGEQASQNVLSELEKKTEQKGISEDQLQKAEQRRLAEEQHLKKALEERLAEEQHLNKIKEERFAEKQRQKEEMKRFAEEQRQLMEIDRLAEEQRRMEEMDRLAEEQRQSAEMKGLAEKERRNRVNETRIINEQHLIIERRDGEIKGTIVEGKITFNGDPPPPKKFEISKFPNPEFCGKVDTDKQGLRILREVTVNGGKLQDVVVYIKDIKKGKPMDFKKAEVTADQCRFLVPGGPSQMVGVVLNKGLIKVTNLDADPSDPKSVDGVLHNPHSYEKLGSSATTMFNLPLPTKGGFIEKKVKLRKAEKGSTLYLECDQHNYMNAWFYPVENPYYAIVGPEGTYSIDQVPPGKYTLLAWHPILGTQEKEINIESSGKKTVNFEFSSGS